MMRFLADPNFNRNMLDGLLKRVRRIDVLVAQEVGLERVYDQILPAWAAEEDRVLLSQDKRTIPGYAYDRMIAKQPMPGVVIVPMDLPVPRAIEDLVLLITCSTDAEWRDRVLFLPVRH